jgi:hypothetical protein
MDAPATRTFSSLTPDERRELYETDPDRFHELAAAAIRKACTGSTEARTQKLRQMQWVIEGRLRKQKTPQQRLQEMQMIFYDGLYGNDGLLFRMNSACTTLAEAFKGTGAGGGKPTLRVVEKRRTLSPLAKS